MWLTRLAITRPVTILMLVLAIVVMGLQSRSRLPVDLYPDIDFPVVVISTIYPGTGPEEVETLLSKPIEDAVSSVSGIKKISSDSTEGASSVVIQFELGTELNEATADIRSKLDALRNALPQDAEAPVVIKADVGAIPVVSLSLGSKRRTPQEMRRLADDLIKDRLSQLPGVAAVSVSGGEIREVRVEVDKSRLEAYGLSISQVVSALRAENLNLPSGSIEEAQRTAAVRVMGEFTSPEQIRDVRIASAMGNPNLRVRDVAQVYDTVEKSTAYTRVDRASSVTLSVQKQSDANTVKVVESIREELEKMTGQPFTEAHIKAAEKLKREGKKVPAYSTQAELPADIQMAVALDQSVFINDTLSDVYKSLFEGAFLAILIVFLFLHSIRGTFIVALAIPTALIGTFLVMDAIGFSMNMMTMLGLSLVVGILVDDSIVVLENIHRHLQMGESPKEASINGRTEIGLAAVTITMVDVVVFVPIAFMGGIVGQFFRQFGIVVATATLFSLFVSFTLTPMLASRWLKSHKQEEDDAHSESRFWLFRVVGRGFQRFVDAWERFYGAIDRTYRVILAWALDHPWIVICCGLMVMLTSFATAMEKPSPAQWAVLLPVMLVIIGAMGIIWYGRRFGEKFGRRVVSVLASLLIVAVLVADKVGYIPQGTLPIPSEALVPLGVSLIIASLLSSYVGGVLLSAAVSIAGVAFYTQSQPFNALIPMLLVMSLLAILALVQSLPRDWAAQAQVRRVVRPLAAIYCGLVLVILVIPGKFGFEFSPSVDNRQFSITIEREVGTSLGLTDATARKVEEALFSKEFFPSGIMETKTVFTTVGSSGGNIFGMGGGGGGDTATMSVELKDLDDLGIKGADQMLMSFGLKPSPLQKTNELIRHINEVYKDEPGVKIMAKAESGMGGGGAPITIEVSGPDMNRVNTVAGDLMKVLKDTPGTFSVEQSWRQGRPELQAHIDRDRAAEYGISVAQIASALRTSLEGDTSTKYREGGEEYDIRVILPETQRDLMAQVPSMVVGNTPAGTPVYLYEVVRLDPSTGPTKVERINRQRAVTVSAYLAEGFNLGNVQQQILADEAYKKIDTHGTTVYWAGESEDMQESGEYLGSALLLAVLLVFMLMAALFESLLAPLIIMLAVPQAMAGAIFALTLTHKSLSIVTMIGIIMLVGLVTKNAILMVDYTNTLRKEKGKDRRTALLEAGPTRLRPILMTTLAMIFGMLPTAIALSKGSEFRQPMAISVIGGLLLSMFLTLVMVPVFYQIMDDISGALTRVKNRVTGAIGARESAKSEQPAAR